MNFKPYLHNCTYKSIMIDEHPNRDEYTVGWICALTHELDACRLMLDDEHDDPEGLAE